MKKIKFNFKTFSYALFFILLAVSWFFIIVVDEGNFFGLFTEKNAEFLRRFLQGLVGAGEETPTFLQKDAVLNILELMGETLWMSILAIGFATIAMLITVLPSARNVADGSLLLKKHWYDRPLFLFLRLIYIITRAIPELVWAMIIIFIFQPGILPGAIALALHNYGILGKLCAEVIEDLKEDPIRNLASCGANSVQIMVYGIAPAVTAKFLTYIIYRWEVIIRTTIVVGFVGAGGLGMQFKLAMSYFRYSEITLILIAYLLLVWLADIVSNQTRKIVS